MPLASAYLPSEIMLITFSFLPILEIQKLRLVSRYYHNCASQYLIRSLSIASDPKSLQFWENISSNDLFRRGVSKIVYNTGLTFQPRRRAEPKHHGKKRDTVTNDLSPSAIEQCYKVYYLLRAGIPHLPLLREVVVTDQLSRASVDEFSAMDWNSNQWRTRMTGCHDSELSLFILLRAFSAVHSAPERFDMNIERFIPGSTRRSQSLISSKDHPTSTSRLFEKCLDTAVHVFENLRELKISTRGPDIEDDVAYAAAFTSNLTALVLTAGPLLEILQVVVQDMPIPPDKTESTLFSTMLFKKSPTCWPMLRSLELRGVDISGFELIAFLSRQSLLEKLVLQDIYLTHNSPAWTSLIDDLCHILGAQFEDMGAGLGQRRRCNVVMPMERIQLSLDRVFEPWDEGLDGALTVRAEDLSGFFEGKEPNPLRGSYESFVIGDER